MHHNEEELKVRLSENAKRDSPMHRKGLASLVSIVFCLGASHPSSMHHIVYVTCRQYICCLPNYLLVALSADPILHCDRCVVQKHILCFPLRATTYFCFTTLWSAQLFSRTSITNIQRRLKDHLRNRLLTRSSFQLPLLWRDQHCTQDQTCYLVR